MQSGLRVGVTNNSTPNYLGNSIFLFLATRNRKRSLGLTKVQSKPITVSSISKRNRTRVCSRMEGQTQLVFPSSETDKYSKELEVAVRAVQMACLLCPESLISKTNGEAHSNDDDSPVTIADWSVQAIVSWALAESFGSENISILAEEHAQSLSKANAAGLLEAVVKTVNNCLAEAARFGFQTPLISLGTSDVLEAISRCNSTGGRVGRFWVLSPVDGTSGFVCADQYAVALALIEDGKVVLGVLGCPNYPMKKEWLSYPTSESWERGCVFYARRDSGKAWVQPLLRGEKKLLWPNDARQIQVSSIDDPAFASFCEPVNKANSSHCFTAGSAHSVGLRNQPLCDNSMVKYAAIGCGHAEVFMKYVRAGCKERIWDHAAGGVIIQEAGGVVTDIGGHPLDFSKGLYLEGLNRGVIASAGAKLHDKITGAIDASWNSSSL